MKINKNLIDLYRYKDRLENYLFALEDLVGILEDNDITMLEDDNNVINEIIPPYFISRILPFLCKAFNSENAFIVDGEKNETHLYKTKTEAIENMDFDDSDYQNIFDLMEAFWDRPFVLLNHEIQEEKWAWFRDSKFRIESIFAMIFKNDSSDKSTDAIIIGVTNGSNKPEPYLNEDVMLMESIFKLIQFNLLKGKSIAKKEESTKNSMKRFFWSRLEGDMGFQLRSSEDCIISHLPEINSSKREKRIQNEQG